MRLAYVYPYLQNPLLSIWANFDGVHYISIASAGYANQAAFFPLYPMILRMLVFGAANINYYLVSGLLISNIAFWAALVVFYKLIRLDYSDSVAKWSVVFMLTFPTAFFFGSVYSESLFLLLLLLSFWFVRKGNWLMASVFGIFVSATRLVGALLAPALLLIQRRVVFFLIPVGTLAYAVFNYFRWGDPLHFIKVHGELSNGRSTESMVLVPQTIFRYAKILFSLSPSQFEWWISALELSVFVLVVYLLYKAVKLKVYKSYVAFSAFAFLIPVSSGTFSGLPRYVLVLFPIYIVLAMIKSDTTKKLVAILFAFLLTILLMFFSKGYFIA